MNHFNKIPSLQLFHKVPDTSKVLLVLEKRLPNSCFIYNAVKMSSRFPEQTSIFVLGEQIDESSWIIVTHYTENYGMNIMISADQVKSKISKSEAIEILSESNVIKWNEPHWFIALEKWISELIYETSVTIKGNIISVYPDTLFYMEPQDCLELELEPRAEDPSLKLQNLDLSLGLDFILNTWKYAKNGTREVVQRLIENNESAGVYVNGKPICGVTAHGYGLLGMLYTLKDHRQKGYAKLCMNYAFQELAKNGLFPASSVDLSNKASLHFHTKLGCKTACLVYWICFSGSHHE